MANKNKLEYTLGLNDKEFTAKMKRAGIPVGKLDKELETTGKTGKKTFSSLTSGIGGFAIGVNQGIELISKLVNGFKALANKAIELDKRTTLVEKRLKTTGEEAEGLNSKMKALSETFGVDFYGELGAMNALMKEFGDNSQKAFDILEQAALKAPDQFGEVLEQVKEYSSQISQIGLTSEQFLAIITTSIQEGIWSDKGIDAIKEFNLSLTEMPETARTAIEALGFSADKMLEEIATGEKTVFELMTEVTKRMKELGLSAQPSRQALADLFKGAGEDAGKFIISLDTMPKKLKNVEDQTGELQKKQLELNKEYAKTEGYFTRLYSDFFKENKDLLKTDITGLGLSQLRELGTGLEKLYRKQFQTKDYWTTKGKERTQEILEAQKNVEFAIDKEISKGRNEYYETRIKKDLKEQAEEEIRITEEKAQAILEKQQKGLAKTTADSIIYRSLDYESAEETYLKLVDLGTTGDELEDARQEKLRLQAVERKAWADEEVADKEAANDKILSSTIALFSALGEKSKAFFYIAQTAKVAEAIMNTLVGDTNISAKWAWNPPVMASLMLANHIQGGLAVAGIAAQTLPKFEDGGEFEIGGKRHSQGGTKFVGSDGSKFEAEDGERMFILNRGATKAYKNLSALNSQYVGKKFESGGSMTTISQPSFNVPSSQVNLGNQTIRIELDGKVIAEKTNYLNNNSTGSGQNLLENT